MPNHLFGDVDRDELLAVMHSNGMADHLRNDGRTARPRLHYFLFVPRVERLHAISQRGIYERTLLQRTTHSPSSLIRLSTLDVPTAYSSTRRSLIHCARRTFRKPRTGPETRCECGQNGHTNRVPCWLGCFSTSTAHPDLQNR